MTVKLYRVLICGDRNWTDKQPIYELVSELKALYGMDLLVITGGAKGADSIAWEVCTRLGVDQAVFPANWEGRGKAAGPYRNRLMHDATFPHEVHCFHADIERSKGTKNMHDYALKQGVAAVFVHTE